MQVIAGLLASFLTKSGRVDIFTRSLIYAEIPLCL